MFNGSFRHGGIENALFKPTIYQGFNVYRDLMNVGDTKDTTYTWVIGTNGGKENGGSLILTNSEGDFAISTIKDGRGGGDSYRGWEQRLSTRDVLNNIKLIVKKDGSVGIGNAAGYDLDAYSSLERNPDTGFVNYVPRSADADGLTAGPYTAGSGTGYNREWGRTGSYGFVNYAGLSATWTETSATTYASQVNSNATRSETFKLEVAADKLHGRPGRTLENRGYGYPPNLSSQGIGTIQRYLVKNPSSGSSAVFASFAISTDQEGRITSASFTTDLSLSGYEDTFLSGVMFPHPTEFEDGGSQNMSTGFIAPAGAAAAAWDNGPITISGGNNLLGFQKDPLLLANLRLNNFVAGEGEGFTGIGYNAEMIAARTQSPKLVFTFLEGTGSAIPPNVPFGARPNGNVYTLPYRKVNTVLASAQNESSLREYWIPKADNSGGTLMVFTDHYGKKEKDTGFDRETIKVENLRLDEVVTLEFVTNLIGVNRTLAGTTAGAGNTALNAAGPTYTSLSYFPTNVLYKRLIMDESLSLGITSGNGGLTSALMNSDAFGIVNTQAPIPQGGNDSNSFILGNPFIGGGFQGTGTIGGYSSAIGFSGGFRACTTRNIEKYYNIQNDSTNWMDGWNDPNVENKMSEVRFKRINSDYVLFDFNLTFNVKNPKMSDQSNDQTSPEEPGYAIGGYGSVLPSNGTGAPQTLIDFGSPRWTQYIRLKYFPSADDGSNYTRNQYLNDLYGNGLGISNWSAYKNWYPGVAVVGPLSQDGLDSPTNTGDPAYIRNTSADGFNRWTGNLINYGWGPGPTAQNNSGPPINWWGPPSSLGAAYGAPVSSGTAVSSQLFTWRNVQNISLNYAQELEALSQGWYLYSASSGGPNGDPGGVRISTANSTDVDLRTAYLAQFRGAMFQLMGNRAWSRTRSCMWRVVPAYANYYQSASPASDPQDRNSFVMEIMFDEPILHIDTQLSSSLWSQDTIDASEMKSYYKYLTISGQSMVRYVAAGKFDP
jgi:hypothetical protein